MAGVDAHLRPDRTLRIASLGCALAALLLAVVGALLLVVAHVFAVFLLCTAAWSAFGCPLLLLAWRRSAVEAERALRAEADRGMRTQARWLHPPDGLPDSYGG